MTPLLMVLIALMLSAVDRHLALVSRFYRCAHLTTKRLMIHPPHPRDQRERVAPAI